MFFSLLFFRQSCYRYQVKGWVSALELVRPVVSGDVYQAS
jgi:hypothetical protein